MALPTMPSQWSTRRNPYEQSMVNQRNRENDYHNKWMSTAKHFHRAGVEASKQTAWTSDKTYEKSMNAYMSKFDKEKKSIEVKRRRLKLMKLLEKEKREYEAELKEMTAGKYGSVEEMRGRTEGLRSAREEKRKQVVSDKLYDHWKQNSHEVRQLERVQFRDHVKAGWHDQLSSQREADELAKKEKEAYEREQEEERVAAIEAERQRAETKRKTVLEVKNYLKDQITELKEQEAETENMRTEHEKLLQQQWELDAMEEQRTAREAEKHKHQHGRVLLRQHVAQMKRKSQQIQEELEDDHKLLAALAEKEKEQGRVQSARKDEARADATWMKQVIEDQIRLEKEREAELDTLYQDEAQRMWQKRADEWERERKAREKLMNEVMLERQEQIDEGLDDLKQRQQESLERREELVKEIEIANQMTSREREEQEQAKVHRRVEIEQQVGEKQRVREEEQIHLELEDLDERQAEEEEEDLLRQETERMRIKGYQQREHGHRGRFAWN